MALSIGVSQGSEIKIAQSLLRVKEITQGMITIQLDDGPPQVVTDEERIEIMPSVFVFVGGKPGDDGVGNRLAFEAPKSIKINRLKNAK